MNLSPRFGRRIRRAVQYELAAARACEARGEFTTAFGHLERAHVLAQTATWLHARVHAAMLGWALRQGLAGEIVGQGWRLIGAALKTWLWVPVGNTGGSNVNALRAMPVPADLQRCLDAARR